MIYSDCISLIGNTHKVCQDYAYADEDVIIVSDGCSSSKDSDIGARIFTHCAKHILKDAMEYSWMGLAFAIGYQAHRIVTCMALPPTVLDATLIAAVRDGDKVTVYAYGDGTIVLTDGAKYHVIDINFVSGAPYYLSYLMDRRRQEGYEYEFGSKNKIITESELYMPNETFMPMPAKTTGKRRSA